MKNIKFSRLFAAVTFVAILALAGCKQQPEEEASIYGTWVASEYEKYTVTKTGFASLGAYEGDNLVIVEDDEKNGRIFIKYTKAYEQTEVEPTGDDSNTWNFSPANAAWGTSDYWWRFSATATDVGKWYAISYKDLTKHSVQISGAAGSKTSCNTLEEAKEEFTIDNGYFAYYSECKKQ